MGMKNGWKRVEEESFLAVSSSRDRVVEKVCVCVCVCG